MHRSIVLVLAGVAAAPALAADPWADRVVSYTEGSGVIAGYNSPAHALGEPSRFSADPQFPSVVSPFSPAYQPGQLVSIGAGGSLTLRFDEPITNDAAHPFGIDLLIFGNSGYADLNFPEGLAGPLFGVGGGAVEVSADGTTWTAAPGAVADGAFPTLGYLDPGDPYSPNPGAVPSDFTRPVDPAFNAAGMNFAQIVAAYNGAGGGAGVDIGVLGLSSISFVRISNPAGAAGTVDVDALAAVAAVPAPSAAAALAFAALIAPRRRRS
jgi:hypothetical protein